MDQANLIGIAPKDPTKMTKVEQHWLPFNIIISEQHWPRQRPGTPD